MEGHTMSIKFSEDVRPITDLKTKASELVSQLKSTKRPLLITQRGRPVAVLEDVTNFELREQKYSAIEKILAGMKQSREGKLHPNDEAIKILDSWGADEG